MDITLTELFQGKPTIIKNKEFFPTRTYVEPFIEKMSKYTDNFLIQVKTPDQITVSKDIQDLTYNRVLIQAILPDEFTVDNHAEVIGFLYGIDVRRPVAKIYRGHLNMACTNLTVFNPEWMTTQELIPGDPLNYSALKNLPELTNDFALKLKALKSNYVSREERKEMLGGWIDHSLRESQDYGFGKVKIAVSTSVDAYKQLFIDQDSKYYIPENVDPTMYDIYNSFTQVIQDDKRDIMNKFEKTMIINELVGIDKVF